MTDPFLCNFKILNWQIRIDTLLSNTSQELQNAKIQYQVTLTCTTLDFQ